MPFCNLCGKEIEEEIEFCPYCGASTKQTRAAYKKPRRSWTITRFLSILLGGIIILISFAFIVGGGAIIWAYDTFGDSEGFLMSREVNLQVDSYAMVIKGLDIDVDLPSNMWARKSLGLITLKLTGRSNDPSKEIFIGMAQDTSARVYLNNVGYDEVIDFRWSYNPWMDSDPEITLESHLGRAPSGPPIIHSFWVEHSLGSGTQYFEWESDLSTFLEHIGNYWIVAMNTDGSDGIDFTIQVGVKVPILKNLRNLLMLGGLIGILFGVTIIYYGMYRRHARA